MANPFARLKEARENKKMSIETAAKLANVRPEYLEALERADFSALPEPLYVRIFIRAYARVLGIDPNPLLRYYRMRETEPPMLLEEADNGVETMPLSRSQSRSRKKKHKKAKIADWERVRATLLREIDRLNKKIKWILIGSLTVLVVAVIAVVWLFMAGDKSSAQEVKTVTPAVSNQKDTTAPVSEKRPTVSLLKTPESNYKYGDLYGISNADQVEVTIKATKSTGVRVRSGGPTGQVLADKELAAGETVTYSDPKWISLRIDHPNQVMLYVNGVLIDTSGQEEVSLFQFKLRDQTTGRN
jgi:cytoskeletal protein RodZ